MKTGINIFISLLAGALIFSCQKENYPEVSDELAVNPIEIEASASLASYVMDVTSNARWTVKVEGVDGADASWISLSRTSGNGNLQVSVRVSENRYNEPRAAAIVFETAGGERVQVSLTQLANEVGEEAPDGDILYVGSYNLRMSHLDKGENAWEERKDRLKSSLMACPFDVFGVQEVDTKTQTWLDSELSSKYAFRYFSPYAKDGKGTKAQGIGYRKDKFELVEWHYFWACSTPFDMTVNDTGTEGSFNRGGCCCILMNKTSGAKYFVMNNHGCLNDQSNIDAAPVYVEMEKKFNKEALPSFFVGDMNAKQSSVEGSVYMIYTAHWTDSYLEAAKRTGASGTYNAYKHPNGSSRIDMVLYRGEGITPQLYNCDNTLYGGLYPSDHFPVWVEFKIER